MRAGARFTSPASMASPHCIAWIASPSMPFFSALPMGATATVKPSFATSLSHAYSADFWKSLSGNGMRRLPSASRPSVKWMPPA